MVSVSYEKAQNGKVFDFSFFFFKFFWLCFLSELTTPRDFDNKCDSSFGDHIFY